MNNIQLPDPYGAREYFVRKTRYSTGPVELQKAIDAGEDLNIVDVREAEDYQKGHVPGSVNLPLSQLRDRYRELPKDRDIWISCGVGQRAYYAVRFLAQHGYRALNLSGGFATYTAFRDAGLTT